MKNISRANAIVARNGTSVNNSNDSTATILLSSYFLLSIHILGLYSIVSIANPQLAYAALRYGIVWVIECILFIALRDNILKVSGPMEW